MSEDLSDDSEQLPYELPYEEQPDGVWMRCPWEGDPEASENKMGDYAKKCPCPNCLHHVFSDDPEGKAGILTRLYWWIKSIDPNFCGTCSRYNDCTRDSADCGLAGRITEIRLADNPRADPENEEDR